MHSTRRYRALIEPLHCSPRTLTLIVTIAFFGYVVGSLRAAEQRRPNVLFIAIDDLNDWVSILGGHPDARTPNLERLAKRGVVFTNAHCVSPVCGPSRAAVMSGLRPETTGAYTNKGQIHDYVPRAQLIPQAFMAAGYHVMGAGKLIHPTGNVVPEAFHEYGPGTGMVGGPFTAEELATSNMTPTYSVDRGPGKLKAVLPLNRLPNDRPENELCTFDWGAVHVTEEEMPDGQIANWAIKKLGEHHNEPIFLAAGFYRPHEPLFYPWKYHELYSPNEVELPLTLPDDLNDIGHVGRLFARATWTAGRHETVVRYGQWHSAVAAYLTCVSFIDSLVGKVLDAFDKSEYADNTLIVLWSDHGWHLGEKQHWGKWTPWEQATRVPVIIVPPRGAAWSAYKRNARCSRPVSLLDLYPTLVDMCRIQTTAKLEGNSLTPLLKDVTANWQFPAVTTFGRGNYSIRTDKWRYICYFDGSEELYDHSTDPHEWHNVADRPQYASVKKELAKSIPWDKRFRQLVRMGDFKFVLQANGRQTLMFDLAAPMGIAEDQDIARLHPEIVENVESYIKRNNISSRHVVIDATR